MDPLNPYADNNITLNISSMPALEALGHTYRVVLAILYSATALLAFILNLVAACVLLYNKRSSADLRKYLMNLAFADILMAIFSIPFSYTDFMYGRWIFPLFLCPISNFIQVVAACLVIYTLIAIGIERYFAIVFPLRSRYWFESQTNFMIAIIWMVSLAIGSPLLLVCRAVHFRYNGQEYHDCRESWEGETTGKIYTAVIFVSTFLVPFLALSFLYTSIGVKTFKHIIPGNANMARDEAQLRTKIKVVKMLCTLVSSFAICWMPLQIFNLVLWLFDDLRLGLTSQQYYFFVYSYFLCHFLSIIHSLIDPLIYCFMSKNFKLEDIKKVICCGRCRRVSSGSNDLMSQTTISMVNRKSHNDLPSQQLNCQTLM